jgi:hypothetical protein
VLGVEHNLTTPYSRYKDVVAERANRTILEAARSRLHARKVPLGLWAEAMTCAAYVHNFIPSKGREKSPFELFTGKDPHVGFLRVFGGPCACARAGEEEA